jgi:hypothetical protein
MGYYCSQVNASEWAKKAGNFRKRGFFVSLLEKARNRPMRNIRHQGGKKHFILLRQSM